MRWSERVSDGGAHAVAGAVREVPVRVFGHELLASVFELAGGRAAVCLHLGRLAGGAPLLVRVHSACLTGEVLESDRCDCAWQLRYAVELIAGTGRGLIVYLPGQDGRGAGLVTLVRSFPLMDAGLTSREAFGRLGVPADSRDYATAVVALEQLGVKDVVMITDNPHKVAALQAAGINVHGRVSAKVPTNGPELELHSRRKLSELTRAAGGRTV